ncbi:MAG: phosphate ABC transporter permease PstA [Oscillospiraceae bacterium]
MTAKLKLNQRIMTWKAHPASFVFFLLTCAAAAAAVGVFLLLIGYILVRGVPYLTPELFAWDFTTENASMTPALITTLEMVALSLAIAAPLGIACAVYLVEYAKRGNKLVGLIRVTTETLAGIPSIVYGLFGMLFFVTYLHWGYSLLAGAFTLAIMVLPLIIRSTEEALKAVDDSWREASFGLGAGKLRTISRVVLPAAVNGILAGIILAVGRIVGETAALVYTAGTVAQIPDNVLSSARTLSIHMYSLSNSGLYMNQAAATAVVLVLMVILINAAAGLIAGRISRASKA